MSRIGLIWPPQAVVTESLFRHFSGIAEVASYLRDSSLIAKKLNVQVEIYDCALVPYTAMNMAQIVYNNDLICIFVNMNNIVDALNAASFFRSVDATKKILAYGEAICCNPRYFASLGIFDYIVSNGQFEIGIEISLCDVHGIRAESIDAKIEKRLYSIIDGIIDIDSCLTLPSEMWGIPRLDMLPLDAYLRISGGEVHITACKGCPFGCEFCNEKYVSSKMVRYRQVNHIVEYLCHPQSDKIKSVYLDASTFTYDKEWVMSLCRGLLNEGEPILPWKTCTRLDHLDENLIKMMGLANCKRISIGVESMDFEIQKRNNKIINLDKLKAFSDACHSVGIQPRALLIIGLKGQTVEEIEYAKTTLEALGIDARFRVLQDFGFLLSDAPFDEGAIKKLDRWLVHSPIDKLSINQLRLFEYPPSKSNQNYS